jgi:hypothetical protein
VTILHSRDRAKATKHKQHSYPCCYADRPGTREHGARRWRAFEPAKIHVPELKFEGYRLWASLMGLRRATPGAPGFYSDVATDRKAVTRYISGELEPARVCGT